MKTTHLIIAFFFLGSLQFNAAKAQYIIAGQHGPKDFYKTAYDTLITCPVCGTSATDTIDVNNDGINDFVVYQYTNETPGYMIYYYSIIPLHTNQVVFSGRKDTCADTSGYIFGIFNIAHSFIYSDTINKTNSWASDSEYTMYTYALTSGPNCNDQYTSADTGIVGLQVFVGNDTLYGWIRLTFVSEISGYETEIIDYACQSNTVGINGINTNGIFNCYPNPSKGIFYFSSNTSETIGTYNTIAVYNTLGQNVYSVLEPATSKQFELDLHELPDGLYLYRLTTDNGVLLNRGKLTIVR